MKSNLLTISKQRTAKKYNYNTQDNSPIIKFYQKIAYSTPVLPNDKEIELLKSAKNKDCSASREALINAYLRTVILLARKYCFGNNLSLEDGIHSGITGVINSIESFDLKKYETPGKMFSYYCYRGILMELTKFYRENIRQFSITDAMNTQMQKINNLYKNGEFNGIDKNENDQLVEFISQKLAIKSSKIKELLSLFSSPIELDSSQPNDETDEISSYKDFFVKTNKEDEPDKIIDRENKYSFLLSSVQNLPDDEKSIINSRYGIDCEKQNISELSKKYKISAPLMSRTISSIEKKLHSLMISEDYGI